MLRTVLYLFAVLPVTWVFATVSALPAAVSMPPDILLQSMLTVPIFVVIGGWLGGRLIPLALIPQERRSPADQKRATQFVVALHIAVCVLLLASALTGLATPRQAVALAAVVILAAHTAALRWLRGS